MIRYAVLLTVAFGSVLASGGCGDDDASDMGADASDAGLDGADTGADATPDGEVDAGEVDAGEDAPDVCVDRCTEVECAGTPSCRESSAAQCSDGLDNDDDGFIDCRDFDCNAGPLVDFCGDENTDAFCSDGIDNDGNGSVDCEDGACVDSPECELTTVRIIAANLTSGPRQSYDPGHGLRILEGLRGDILLVQEMNYRDGSADDLRAFADQACGGECEIVVEPPTLLPNAIVSRYPILEDGVWDDPETDTREFAWARIDVPGRRDLWAVSVHFLTSGDRDRTAEARALVEMVERDIPPDDHLVIGGDFNTFSGAPFDRLATVVETNTRPVDTSGDPDTNGPRERRLDGILASTALHGRETPVRIGDASFPDGLVVDTREYEPLSDLAPAQLEDSGVAGMQHMAVVRDFALN